MITLVVGMLFIDSQRLLHQPQSFLGVALRQGFGQPLMRDIIDVPILRRFRQLDGLPQQRLTLTDAIAGKGCLSLLQATGCRQRR